MLLRGSLHYPTLYPSNAIRTQLEKDDVTDVWIEDVPDSYDRDNIIVVETGKLILIAYVQTSCQRLIRVVLKLAYLPIRYNIMSITNTPKI